MSKVHIKRKKNIWLPLSGTFCTPFAVWEIDCKLLDELISIESRRQVSRLLTKPINLDPDSYLEIQRLLALISARLQSYDSDDVFDWFVGVNSKHDHQSFCYSFLDEKVASGVGPLAVELLLKINSVWSGENQTDLAQSETIKLFQLYQKQIDHLAPSESAMRLLIEAKERGIPTRRHSDRPIYQLGFGAQKRLISNGYTNSTSQLATTIATHKYLAARVMRESGLPVPFHFVVSTIDQAKKAAQEIKYPLVLKPASTDKGIGVTVDIKTEEELTFAWSQARPYGNVLVEEMLRGFDHRLHVIDGKCIYVVKRLPPYVIGNGSDSLERLIESYKTQRLSHPFYKKYPSPSLTDPVVISLLGKQNLSPSTVIESGKVVLLRSNSNISTGGVFEDVTSMTHPDNMLLAERAARIVGLDNAGIDLITTDVSKPWLESGGGICEINPTPMFFLETGYKAFMDYLFKSPRTGRIPIVLLVGNVVNLRSYLEAAVKLQEMRDISFGYIFDCELNICSNGGKFSLPGKSSKDLVTGLLTDEFVRSAFIQVGFDELGGGLDLDYIDLIVAIGTDREISLFNQSEWILRCDPAEILTNPSLQQFQRNLDSLLMNSETH